MLKEINLLGIYVSPIFIYLGVSAVAWVVLRWVLTVTRVYRFIWHAPLFNTALYVLLLAGSFYCLNLDPRPAPVSYFARFLSNLFS